MDDEKKIVDDLSQVFAAGEGWLRKYGVVSSISHNSIVANLYVNFAKVKYLEYFLPKDTSKDRKVWVILYVPFWKLVFTNRDRLIDDVIGFLREYLDGYEIRVDVKRYRRGVESSNEVPKEAIAHVDPSSDGLSGSSSPDPRPDPQGSSTEGPRESVPSDRVSETAGVEGTAESKRTPS